MSSFTPGPWRIESRIYQMGRKLSGHVIAHGINSHGDGPEGYICRTEWSSEEDARLLAAAPELLSALQHLLRHSGIADVDPRDKDKQDQDIERAARAAIAKAEGRDE